MLVKAVMVTQSKLCYRCRTDYIFAHIVALQIYSFGDVETNNFTSTTLRRLFIKYIQMYSFALTLKCLCIDIEASCICSESNTAKIYRYGYIDSYFCLTTTLQIFYVFVMKTVIFSYTAKSLSSM